MTETQEQISDALINKVRGLLRLSKSTNQHEAELAMKHAKRLCVQYDLDMASIDANKTKNTEEPIEKRSFEKGTARRPVAQMSVSAILQDHFNVKILYQSSRWNGFRLIMIGRKRDIEIAQWVNEFLNEEFLRLWRKHYAKNKPLGMTIKNRAGYIYGLEKGLSQKLTEEKEKAERAAFNSTAAEKVDELKNRYALINVSLKKRIEDKTNEFYPRTRNIRRGYAANFNSLESGMNDGRQINLNRPLGNGSRGSRLTN